MRVTAVRKGYFGGKIRDAGEVFDLPDALMKTKPSWVAAVGEAGVASPEPETVNPADPATRKRGRKPKASSSPPSAEAPAESSIPAGNGVTEALGGPPPDWLPGDMND